MQFNLKNAFEHLNTYVKESTRVIPLFTYCLKSKYRNMSSLKLWMEYKFVLTTTVNIKQDTWTDENS